MRTSSSNVSRRSEAGRVEQVAAVVEQADVGAHRHAIERALVAARLERRRQERRAARRREGGVERQQPAGGGELRGPGDVQVDEIERVVARQQRRRVQVLAQVGGVRALDELHRRRPRNDSAIRVHMRSSAAGTITRSGGASPLRSAPTAAAQASSNRPAARRTDDRVMLAALDRRPRLRPGLAARPRKGAGATARSSSGTAVPSSGMASERIMSSRETPRSSSRAEPSRRARAIQTWFTYAWKASSGTSRNAVSPSFRCSARACSSAGLATASSSAPVARTSANRTCCAAGKAQQAHARRGGGLADGSPRAPPDACPASAVDSQSTSAAQWRSRGSVLPEAGQELLDARGFGRLRRELQEGLVVRHHAVGLLEPL